MLKVVSVCLAALCSLAINNASAENILFKSYVYDSPIASYSKAPGYYDCSAEIGAKALCHDNIQFVGKEFSAILVFSDEKLILLSLVAEYDQSLFAKAFGALNQSFTLLMLADKNSQLDLVELGKKSATKADYTAAVNKYEAIGLNSGELTYTFLEQNANVKNAKNYTSALAAAPDTSRAADLLVSSEGGHHNLMIRFSLPKLESKRLEAEINKPAEKF